MKKSNIFLVASIVLVLIGFCGVVVGISGDGVPSWATIALIVGGISFLLWIVVLTTESVANVKATQKQQHATKLQQANAERQYGNRQYQELCQKAHNILKTANKPSECNNVCFVDEPFLFPDLKSYQYCTEWEIWRNEDIVFFYNASVENYPETCFEGEAPAIGSIEVKDIQYFAMEGNITSETIVSGGVVKQDKKTGKVSQSALKSKTVERDKRVVRLSVLKSGIVKKLLFSKDAYDVFLALIPEKEKSN